MLSGAGYMDRRALYRRAFRCLRTEEHLNNAFLSGMLSTILAKPQWANYPSFLKAVYSTARLWNPNSALPPLPL